MKTSFLFLLVLACVVGDLAGQSKMSANSSAVASMNKKLQYVQKNATQTPPDPKPTEFNEQEVNSYLSSGEVKLPQGVQSVQLQGQPDVITGTARVDFDQLKQGARNSNPLLSMFSGVHDLTVIAHARGMNHKGYVQVDSASLDGVEIPRFALELFLQKYVTPKYPGVGMNSQFDLPAKIDTATVGQHKVTIVQK
jgi:hypothetical protein